MVRRADQENEMSRHHVPMELMRPSEWNRLIGPIRIGPDSDIRVPVSGSGDELMQFILFFHGVEWEDGKEKIMEWHDGRRFSLYADTGLMQIFLNSITGDGEPYFHAMASLKAESFMRLDDACRWRVSCSKYNFKNIHHRWIPITHDPISTIMDMEGGM